jgi:AAA domain
MSAPASLPRCESCGRVREVAAVMQAGGIRMCLDCFHEHYPDEGVPQPVITGPLPPETANGQPKPAPPPKRTITLRPASDYPARPLFWLWKPYVPLGKVVVLAGPPGQGKSQLSLWIAARITRGELIHDVREPADVVLISAEDDPHDTIGPRLTAVGADHTRVHIVSVKDPDGGGALIEAALELPRDGAALAASFGKRPVKLLIVDPVSAFLGAGVDSYKNASVRRALFPLKELAEKAGVAVLMVTHLTKSGAAGEPLDRVIDSVAFTALARSVALMAADPEDTQGTRGSHKVLVLAKSNIAPPGEHPMRFELVGKEVPTELGPAGTSCVVQRGAADDVSASDLMMPPDERSALGGAYDFLREELLDGWKPSTDVKKAADQNGISERTLRRAKEMLCDTAKERGGTGRWWIGLKTMPPPPECGGPEAGSFEASVLNEAERHLREAARDEELREQVRRQKEEGGHDPHTRHVGHLGPDAQDGQDDQAQDDQAGQDDAGLEGRLPPDGWQPYKPSDDADEDDDDWRAR